MEKGQEIRFMVTVRMVTTNKPDCVVYEVFVNGKVKWIRTVFFGHRRENRAGGYAFKQAAMEQEEAANRALIGKL